MDSQFNSEQHKTQWLWISLRASHLPLDFLNDVWNTVSKPLLNRGTLHMPIRGHSFWKHSCLRGQTHVAWVCVCDSPESQETGFSCHTQPQTATLFVLFACRSQGFHLLRLQRLQPTRLLLRISRCEKHFFICLLIFIHSKGGIVGGSKRVSHD